MVGPDMFNNCPVLTSIEFPEKLTTIGINTFTGVPGMKTLKMNRSLWTQINSYLPATGTQVILFYNDPVFYTWNSGNLVPGTGLFYDNGVFSGSYNGFLSITGAGALTRSIIDAYVTKNGSNLGLVIDVDSTFTSLDEGIFSGLTGLTAVRFSVDSAIQTVGARTFQGCSSLTNISVPSGVTILEDDAFRDATSLVSVEFLGPILTLRNNVFKGCSLLKEIIFRDGLTTLGSNTFEDCTSLETLIFPPSLLSIDGTKTLAGATAVRSLKMREELWETAIKPSLVENPGVPQLVQFYGDATLLETLETQSEEENNTKGYQTIVDYYTERDNYTVDWTTSSGGAELVKNGTTGLTYDMDTGSLLTTLGGFGTYDRSLTIVGAYGVELTQILVDAAINAHSLAQKGLMPLHTLTVGANFTSFASTLSLQGTGLMHLHFPAESPITTTGTFRLSIDSSLNNVVTLPRWVVQQGPWSLII
jgi:hypothetical protein